MPAQTVGRPGTLPGVDNTDLFTIHPDGTGLRDVSNSQAAEADPVWSPDGSKVVFVRNTSSGLGEGGLRLRSGVYTMRADGTDLRQILSVFVVLFL